MFHPQLQEQLRKYYKPDRVPEELFELLYAISETYEEQDSRQNKQEKQVIQKAKQVDNAQYQLQKSVRYQEVIKENLQAILYSLEEDEQATENQPEIMEVIDGLKGQLQQHQVVGERLQSTIRAIKSANTLKDNFLSTISHEVRTPLNGVLGMTSLLMHTKLTEEQEDYVETIRVSGNNLLTIINDILDYSKIESGRMDLEFQPFEISRMIEEGFDLLTSQAENKNIDLLYLIDNKVPSFAYGDVTRIRQVLVNLVENGIKFSNGGEVLVYVQTIAQSGDDLKLQFSIQDKGIGIASDKSEELFNVFSQVDSSTTRRYGGTGLGLAICKRLVGMMGGKIWVESESEKGSTFTFTIKSRIAPASKETYLQHNQSDLFGKQVLIVDDNETNRKILKLQLEQWGMNITTASSGKEALACLGEGLVFDFAILDFLMPEMNGLQLAENIRARWNEQQLPLMLLSSAADILEQESRILFQASLHKPIKQLHLWNTVLNLSGQDNSQQQQKVHTDKLPIEAPLANRLPLKILLAEDNALNQRFALKIFKMMGYVADVAANGFEVLGALKRQAYDIIFMDIQMPEMDGIETTQHIVKVSFPETRPKIIAMAGNLQPGDRDLFLKAGMDGYISKPIDALSIQRVLEDYGKKKIST